MRERSKDAAAKVVNVLHRTILEASKGRLAASISGMPVVELTTIGRKSGQKRTTMLTTPVHDDDMVVLVASYGGDDRHPAWFLNLRENPEVEIVMQGDRREMRARVASAEERATLWPKVISKYRGYAQYQTRTDRDIPLVVLEPPQSPPTGPAAESKTSNNKNADERGDST